MKSVSYFDNGIFNRKLRCLDFTICGVHDDGGFLPLFNFAASKSMQDYNYFMGIWFYY